MPQKLTEQQNLELAIGLSRGEKPWELAEKVGCSAKTVYQRMKNPEFMKEIEVLSSQSFRDLPSRFRGAVTAAFETILSLSQTADRDSTKLQAAKLVLDYAGVQPLEQAPEGGMPEADVYCVRGDDGVYRPIVLLPGGGVVVEGEKVGT